MKTFTRIFMAITTLVAVSCTTDVTEDLGVQLGSVGQTTISLSLEGTKTHLGEKSGESYPLYWSAGDQIAVNGVASEALPEEAHGKVAATFTLNGELTYPYNIVYPAPAEGVVAGEGLQAVTFPANQTYKAGTFAEGTAPLYAEVAAEGDPIVLQHLSGVLRFAPKGEGVTLTSMTIVAESGKIAGNFDVNCADGTLVAHEDATNAITVSFGEGLALGEEDTPIYVAIPAGEYGLFTVTLNTASDSMSVKFNSEGEKAIKAGVVREFGEFVYEANESTSEIFEIYDEASLRRFAAMAAPRKNAIVTASIDMTGKEWTPIEGFGAFTFDGGSDKGYEIKGLSAPLFGEATGSTIKNVKLTDVAIEITDITYAGAIVCTLKSEAVSTAKLENCEASGAIVYSNNSVTLGTNFDSTLINVGGLVGRAYSATISGCTNRVAITDKLSTPTGTSNYDSPSFGGIVAHTYAVEGLEATTLVSNCHNYGGITIDDAKASQTYSSPIYAGIVGCAYEKTSVIEHCHNYAPMFQKTTCREADVAGIVGRGNGKIDNCVNHEDATISFGAIGRYSFPGGIVGNLNGHTISNCTNKADIIYDPKVKSNTGYQYMGGIAGHVRTAATTITNCVNEGAIINLADAYGGSSNCYVYAGGIIGYCNIATTISGCENKGEITMGGTKGSTMTSSGAHSCVGGIVGYSTKDATSITSSTNNGVINYNVKIYGQGSYSHHRVGGISGYYKGSLTNCENLKAININTTVMVVDGEDPTMATQVGGLCGIISGGTATTCTNKGDVVFGADAEACGYCIGGLVGNLAEGVLKSSNNEGQVKVLGDSTLSASGKIGIHIGGLAGYSSGTIDNCANGVLNDTTKGKITISGKIYPSLDWGGILNSSTIGGLAGVVQGKNPVTSYNYAPIDITFNNVKPIEYSPKTTILIGGLTGYTGKTWSNCANYGDITISGEHDYAIRVGGCISRNANANHTNIDNFGDIIVKDLILEGACYIGGIDCGVGSSKNLANCDNSGNICVESTATITGNVYLGGISHTMNSTVDGIVGCTNSGTIMVDGNITGSAYIGGCIGSMNKKDNVYIKNFTNKKEAVVKLGDNAVVSSAVYVGGIVADWPHNEDKTTAGGIENSTNSGLVGVYGTGKANVIVGGITGTFAGLSQHVNDCTFDGQLVISRGATNAATIKDGYFGGLAGSQSGKVVSVSNFTSKGTITFAGKTSGTCRIGGIIGSNTQTPAEWTGLLSLATINFEAASGNYNVAKTFIGGITGYGEQGSIGSRSYCQINVAGADDGISVGMILGNTRGVPKATDSIAKNCQLGGIIVTGWDYEDAEPRPLGEKIDESNFMNYIYGGTVDWTGVENYDGCTALTTKPTVE